MVSLLKKYKFEILLIVGAFSAYGLLDIALPLCIGLFPRYLIETQKGLTSQHTSFLFLLFGCFVVARHYLIYFFSKVGFKTIFKVYESISDKSLAAKLNSVSTNKLISGDLQKVASSDVDFIVGGMIIPASTFFVEFLILMVSIFLFIDAIGFEKFALMSVPFSIIVSIILYRQVLINKSLGDARNEFVGKKLKIISYIESLSYEIFAYDAINYASNLFAKVNSDVARVSANQSRALVQGRINLETSYSVLLVVFIMFTLYNSSNLEQDALFFDDTLVLVFALSIRLIPGVGRIIQSTQSISYVWPTVNHLLRSLKSSSESSNPPILEGAVTACSSHSLINISKGNLSIDGKNLFKIKNLTIPNQGIITIYGESGAGKSSFLLALFNILSSQPSLQVSYMQQHIPLPIGSIYEYIALSKNYSKNQIDQLLVSTKLDFLVHNYSDERDQNSHRPLSGGQIQRLALARAIYHNSGVILLDEFTSALDNNTQNSIMQWLKTYSANEEICVICTSHRQALKKYSDIVLTIDNGILSQAPLTES